MNLKRLQKSYALTCYLYVFIVTNLVEMDLKFRYEYEDIIRKNLN